MPLKLEMKMGDRIIINGAVVEVISPHAKIILLNQAALLRGKEILPEEQATTPATRVYFALQNAYLFPEQADEHLQEAEDFISQYEVACPSATGIVSEIRSEIADGQLYRSLKKAQGLIGHQQGVLSEFEEQLVDFMESDARGDDSEDDDKDDQTKA